MTGWTTRAQAANIVFEKFAELCKTLEKMIGDSSTPKDTADKIKGLLKNHLSSLEVLFNLNATRKLLSVSEKLSKELQAVGISADYALYSEPSQKIQSKRIFDCEDHGRSFAVFRQRKKCVGQ